MAPGVRRTVAHEPEHQPPTLLSALAPPMAWWWWVLAGASALLLGLGTLRVIQFFARPMGLVILGIAIAAALEPVVDWLARWLTRRFAIIFVYLVILLFLVGLSWWAAPNMLNQARELRQTLPQQIEMVREWLEQRLPFELDEIMDPMVSQLSNGEGQLIQLPFTIATTTFDAVINIIAVAFISIYALLATPDIRRFALSLVPEQRRDRLMSVAAKTVGSMGGWVRGTFISALLIALLTYLGLMLLGVQYALVLGIVAGLLEVIPVFGSFVASVIVVTVALFQSFELGLYALLLMLVVQQIEGNIVMPNVMSSQTQLNPLTALVAVVAAGMVGGLFAILVSIPLAAALVVIVKEVVAPLVRRWTGATPETELSAAHAPLRDEQEMNG